MSDSKLTEHYVECEFDGGTYLRLICKAPAQSLCHTTYSCQCESWSGEWIEDGKPRHKAYVDYGEPEIHIGKFQEDCGLEEWFSADCGESLEGKIVLPIKHVWADDHVEFSVDVEQLQQQVEKILGDYVEFIQDVQEQWDDGKPIKFGDNFKKFDATVAAVVGLLKGETE